MPTYPDRRSRYSGVFPWEAASVVSHTPAHRGDAPRDNFRVTTADVPKPGEEEWEQQLDGTWAKKPVAPLNPVPSTQTPAVAPASPGEPANAKDSALLAASAASSSET